MFDLPPKPEALTKMFPWEQKSIAVNGRRMAYVDEGARDAAPVLLLHGNPTWGFLYRDFIEPLRKAGYRVIVPDCIGAGYSSKPRIDAAHSLAHHIADLVSLIDQLELPGFTIVGQDWGGPQGIGAALQRLSRLKAMVLMNTWAFTDYVGPFHQNPRPWTTWAAGSIRTSPTGSPSTRPRLEMEMKNGVCARRIFERECSGPVRPLLR